MSGEESKQEQFKELNLDLGDEFKDVDIRNLVGGASKTMKNPVGFSNSNSVSSGVPDFTGGARTKKAAVAPTKETNKEEENVEESVEVKSDEGNNDEGEGRFNNVNAENNNEAETEANDADDEEEKETEKSSGDMDDEEVVPSNEDEEDDEEKTTTEESKEEEDEEEANNNELRNNATKQLLNLTDLKTKFNEMVNEMREDTDLVEVEELKNAEQLKTMLSLFDDTKLRLNVLNKMIEEGMITL